MYVHRAATDMRKSFHTLAVMVTQSMAKDALSGDLYLFVGKDRRRAKVLFFDGTGLCLFSKVLSRGRFPAPWESAGAVVMTQSELTLFLEGAERLGQLSPPELDLSANHVKAADFR